MRFIQFEKNLAIRADDPLQQANKRPVTIIHLISVSIDFPMLHAGKIAQSVTIHHLGQNSHRAAERNGKIFIQLIVEGFAIVYRHSGTNRFRFGCLDPVYDLSAGLIPAVSQLQSTSAIRMKRKFRKIRIIVTKNHSIKFFANRTAFVIIFCRELKKIVLRIFPDLSDKRFDIHRFSFLDSLPVVNRIT